MGNVTFLIGNGFDLNCGLRSRYTDTYRGYFDAPSKSDNIKKLKNTMEENIDTWADFELRMAKYAETFESEDAFIECVLDYIEYLTLYLHNQEDSFLETINADNNIENAAIKEVASSIKGFYEGIATKKAKRKIESSIGINRGKVSYRFICYNYTRILDNILNKAFMLIRNDADQAAKFLNESVIHIHGVLDSDVVLGVDNDDQLNTTFPVTDKVRRNFIKPYFNDEFDDERQNAALRAIKNSDVICTFGLELGESDLMWREAIGEWLSNDSGHQLVFFKHKYSSKKYATAQGKMNEEEVLKIDLLRFIYGEELYLHDEIELQDRVHIPLGYNIFNIEEAIKKCIATSTEKTALMEKLKNSI